MNWLYPSGLPIALSLVGYNSLLTGVLVFFKRRDRSGVFYLIFSITVFLWALGLTFNLNNDLPAHLAQNWGRFAQKAALFIPVTWLHFVLIYTATLHKLRNQLITAYAATLLILPFTFTPWFVVGFRSIVSVNNYTVPGFVYLLFTILFSAIVIYSFWVLYQSWKSEKSYQKVTNYKLMFGAMLYGFGTGSLSFLPIYEIPLPQYNLLMMPLWQFLLAYVMTRKQLFDTETLIEAIHRDKLAAIGTLATSINHEVRNPLYIIKGLAQACLEHPSQAVAAAGEPGREKLEKIVLQAERAMDIIKRFSSFAKRETLRESQAESVKPEAVLKEILPLVQHELDTDKIKLTIQFPRDLPAVRADKRQLEEIFFNLIVNACQALKSRPQGEITIMGRREEGCVQLTIQDSGPGLADEQMKHVFEPFYTTKEEGTGLGLYITKQLVERNGGKIAVKSKPGQGTAFTLEFRT